MPLAIEPLHPMQAAERACITLEQALDICDELGDGIGVACDVYHVWWDPKLEQQIRRAGKKRLLAYHICDWLVPTRDLLNDRGMMGDGVIDLPAISWVGHGLRGFQEVEIFSEHDWWKRDPTRYSRCAASARGEARLLTMPLHPVGATGARRSKRTARRCSSPMSSASRKRSSASTLPTSPRPSLRA